MKKNFLNTFSRPTNEVAIVNNSGLFFTLSSLREHGVDAHKNLKIIMPDFWLDKTHSDYDNLDWGQTPRGLPWRVRNEFSHIYPSHGENDYIRWKQFKELRKYAIEELKKLHIQIYTGVPEIKNLSTSLEFITNESSFILPSNNIHIYNSFRVLKTNHGIRVLNGPEYKRSHTDLYFKPKNLAPETIVLLGTGRSTIWAAKHFPLSLIACIGNNSPEDSLFKNENEQLPDNLIFFFSEKKHQDSILFPTVDYDGKVMIKNDKFSENIEFIGDFYCAIGAEQNLTLTKFLPKDCVTLFPFKKPAQWVSSEKLPIGGLMEATLRWAIITNNMEWAYETGCYHGSLSDYLVIQFENNGINLCNKFFDRLREIIFHESDSPDCNKTIDIYKNTYKYIYPNVDKKTLDKIHTILEDIENSRSYENTINHKIGVKIL